MIEDSADFSELLRKRLTQSLQDSFEVECAKSLGEGLALLSKGDFDLLLLDLTLPDSDGLHTFDKVRMLTADIPVVVLTGLENDQMAIEAVRKGAEDYLFKGELGGKILLRVLHHAVERHRIKKELADVTRELRAVNLRLEKMSILDPLTDLYNRRGLQQALSREIKWAARHGWNLLAMIIDLDRFKRINDTYGYAVGDVLLREIAAILKKMVRLTDYVARVGGDEFILLLPEVSYDEGIRIAERIRMAIADKIYPISEIGRNHVTASVGLMLIPLSTQSIDELLESIHPFLRESKNQGRNRVSYEKNGSGKESDSGVILPHSLALLRDGNQFSVVRQPIFDLSQNEIVGYEFLSRLNASPFSMPYDFFRIALENNMLTLVDRHCFAACARASRTLARQHRCHINLFPSTIVDVPVEHLIETLPGESSTDNFCFEISEQQIIGDPGYLMETVQAIKDAGILIAIDDVGFGHSCLESLIVFEPDIVKLDQKYVNHVSQDPKKIRRLERVLKVAEDLEAEVVAEGIESPQDLAVLEQLGVKYGQGFLLGKPAEAE